MSELNPGKLHIRFTQQASPEGPLFPRKYTLTHSDITGELFLTIGEEYDKKQISGIYTRFMRDEVLAEWKFRENEHMLVIHCHVSSGLVFGSPSMRYSIFQQHMRLVLEAFRYGDDQLFEQYPELDQALVQVRFHASSKKFNRVENWGILAKYRLENHETQRS